MADKPEDDLMEMEMEENENENENDPVHVDNEEQKIKTSVKSHDAFLSFRDDKVNIDDPENNFRNLIKEIEALSNAIKPLGEGSNPVQKEVSKQLLEGLALILPVPAPVPSPGPGLGTKQAHKKGI